MQKRSWSSFWAKMRVESGFLAAALLFLAVSCAIGLFVRHLDDAKDSPRRTRTFQRDVLEGLSIRRSGLYGIDLVRCGRLRIEKRKLGPLTLGGFNELVIDDLYVVIPPREAESGRATSEDAAPEASVAKTSGVGATSREILSRMGLSSQFLAMQGLPKRFSGLRVNGLSVARLDGTNAVPCFTAVRAVGAREGLRLEGLAIGGRTIGEGLLMNRKPLRITDSGGKTVLEI